MQGLPPKAVERMSDKDLTPAVNDADLEKLKSALQSERERVAAAESILLEEYKALWTYYIRTLDARERVFEIYTKIVGLPLVLSTGFLFYARSLAPQQDKIVAELKLKGKCGPTCEALGNVFNALKDAEIGLASFFLLSFCAGLGCYNYYVMESLNSRSYLTALSSIRNCWRTQHQQIHHAITIDLIRPEDPNVGDRIVRARGRIFVIFNAAIGSISFWFFYTAARSEFQFVDHLPRMSFLLIGLLFGYAAHRVTDAWARHRYSPNLEAKAIVAETRRSRERDARSVALKMTENNTR